MQPRSAQTVRVEQSWPHTNRLKDVSPDEPYDLVFIDAQKSGYPSYLATILAKSQPGQAKRLLRPGGLIVADNVLRRGIVADDSEGNPHVEREQRHGNPHWRPDDVVKLKEFNDALSSNPRLEAFLLPLYDGVGQARLVD
jgi:predicted O-methyltransferase YrrM